MVEAERQIKLILDPPTAEVGATYPGRVVNITKFGAFVNILPGRDGLLHISKIGGGRRIDRVEDVLSLGDEVTVVVEDVDPNGKISLKPEGAEDSSRGRGSRDHDRDRSRGVDRDRDRGRGGDRDRDRGGSDRGRNGRSDRGTRPPQHSEHRVERQGEHQGEPQGDRQVDRQAVSFEDAFDAELSEEFDNLGPDAPSRGRGYGSGGRGRR